MKYTLLKMTQKILSSMGSDEVNTIADTVESQDVATVIEECYYDIVTSANLKEHDTLFKLEPSKSDLKPTVMYLPDNVQELITLQYNIGTLENTNYQDVCYIPYHQFMQMTNALDITNETVGNMYVDIDGDSFEFKYNNNHHPTVWTTPDDSTVLFDAFDNREEDTLTRDRVSCIGSRIPKFKFEDTFVPDLDAQQFQLLLQSAKAQCFVEIKQTVNSKAEKKERRHRILSEKNKDRTDPRAAIIKHKGYGR